MSKPQSRLIKDMITTHLEAGITSKQEIYTKIVKTLDVPRPTVRRVAGDLRREMDRQIQQMEAQKYRIEEQLRRL